MINIKYCKKCKKPFDIDTSKELCPDCRNKINEGGGDGKRIE